MKSVPHSQAWIRHAKVRRLRCRLRCCVCVRVCCYTEILQGEHVLFGVVKWKLDAQLYTLLARYVCDLHARARAGSTYR